MGMFDKPQYLTGGDGFVSSGEKFWLHQARLDGTTNVRGQERNQAKLQVSRERDSEKFTVWTSGIGVVNQIRRMDASDRAQLPMELRLDQVPSGKGNPTHVLNPADAPAPAESGSSEADF